MLWVCRHTDEVYHMAVNSPYNWPHILHEAILRMSCWKLKKINSSSQLSHPVIKFIATKIEESFGIYTDERIS